MWSPPRYAEEKVVWKRKPRHFLPLIVHQCCAVRKQDPEPQRQTGTVPERSNERSDDSVVGVDHLPLTLPVAMFNEDEELPADIRLGSMGDGGGAQGTQSFFFGVRMLMSGTRGWVFD